MGEIMLGRPPGSHKWKFCYTCGKTDNTIYKKICRECREDSKALRDHVREGLKSLEKSVIFNRKRSAPGLGRDDVDDFNLDEIEFRDSSAALDRS
jgi:hypothetical protein